MPPLSGWLIGYPESTTFLVGQNIDDEVDLQNLWLYKRAFEKTTHIFH